MAEYIKRDKAIAMRFSDGINEDGVLYVPFREVVAHLKSVPAADVRENVRGEWLLTLSDVYDFYKCSVCGHRIEAPGGVPHENFCPNCGASMQTEQKGRK